MDFLPPDRSYPSGFGLHRRHFDDQAQAELIKTVQKAVTLAPWFQPTMPRTGQPLSVRMSNFGPLGWVADRKGYRYQPHHPETGADPGSVAAGMARVDGLCGSPRLLPDQLVPRDCQNGPARG